MRQNFEVFLASSLLLILVSASGQTATYSRTAEFSTIRASQSEIYDLIERVRALIERANFGVAEEYLRENLLLSDGTSELRLSTGFSEEDLSGAPRPSFRLWYFFSKSSAPISHVDISFSDYSREIEVEGNSQEQVDALVALLSSDLSRLESGIGGYYHRFFGGIALLLIGAILASVASTPQPFAGIMRWLVLVLGVAMQISIWVLPWETWLPGTLILPENTTFLERNGPLISLIGLLITIGTVAFPIVRLVTSNLAGPNDDVPKDPSA